MKKTAFLTAALLIIGLSGCAEEDSSTSLPEEPVNSAAETSLSSSAPDSSEEEPLRITVLVKSYKDGLLCFEYEGKEYSLPFDRREFENEYIPVDRIAPNLSEKIINNRLGEKVLARMVLSGDMSRIRSCDVIGVNGRRYEGMELLTGGYEVIRENLYTLTRRGGSLCEISNGTETLECDLNDLPLCWKLDYPQTVYPVLFDGYRFKDGSFILCDLTFNPDVTDSSVSAETDLSTFDMYGRRTAFFGTVETYEAGSVTLLLSDGITRCTVPDYYSDGGELGEGDEIMVLLVSDSSLYGSGGDHSFDYAVICTKPEEYISPSLKPEYMAPSLSPSDLAYGVFTGWDILSCTLVNETELTQM